MYLTRNNDMHLEASARITLLFVIHKNLKPKCNIHFFLLHTYYMRGSWKIYSKRKIPNLNHTSVDHMIKYHQNCSFKLIFKTYALKFLIFNMHENKLRKHLRQLFSLVSKQKKYKEKRWWAYWKENFIQEKKSIFYF